MRCLLVGSVYDIEIIIAYQEGMFLSNFKYNKRFDPKAAPFGSHLFFQVISGRHQQKSTVITTNLPFAEWGKVFDSTTVATAIADRLVHQSEVVILEGTSYRRK